VHLGHVHCFIQNPCTLTGVWECRNGLPDASAHAQQSHSSLSGTSSTQPEHGNAS
jgi:hypothetical protein